MASAYEALPGVDGWPLVGSLPRFTQDPLSFISELRREHGPVARFKIAGLDYVLLSDPEGIQQVLVTKTDSFEKHEYLRFTLGDALGEGLLVAEGDQWRTQRQLAQPSFRPKRVKTYGPQMVSQCQRVLADWQDEPVRNLPDDMSRLALRIAAETLFDVSVDAKADRIGSALDDIMARFSAERRVLSLVPKSVPLPSNLRYQRGVEELHAIVEELIDERIEDDADRSGGDLMGRLLAAYETHEANLDRARLRDELVTFLVAGHETTALTLTWTLWLLGNHPGIQQRLAEQLDARLGDEPPALGALEDVELLEPVIDEAMRLLPAVWAFGRQAVEDVDVAGRTLPEGTQVMISQWVVHRDPALWDDAATFDPQRWLDGRADDKPRFAHFPFGGGPRTCIGDAFAMLEVKLALATLLKGMEVDAVQDQRPELDVSITLRPAEPVPARVTPRDPA